MNIRKTILAIAAVLAAVCVYLWLCSVFLPFAQDVSRESVAPYGRMFRRLPDAIRRWHALDEGYVRLREENGRLAAEAAVAARLAEENQALRRVLDLVQTHPSFVYAEVLSNGCGSGWWEAIRIGKGAADGVREGDTVLATDPVGLVGRIVAVTPHTADVLPITASGHRISCELEGAGAGARGILSGNDSLETESELELLHVLEPCSLEYLDKDLELRPGLRVLTSGLGGMYRAGLPIGEVREVSMDSSRLFQRAKVFPYVDFASLRAVFVLTGPKTGTLPEGGRP